MPAPIDWSAAGGLDSVKQLTINVGPREAARRLGLSDAHSAALRQLCARGKWLAGLPKANQPTLAPAESPPYVTGQPVTNVTTAAQALQNTLEDRNKRSKLSLSKYVVRASARAATLKSAELLAEAQNVKAIAGVAAQVWPEQKHGNQVMISVALLGMPPEQVAGPIVDERLD